MPLHGAPSWTRLRAVWQRVSFLWAKRLAASWRLTTPPPRTAACCATDLMARTAWSTSLENARPSRHCVSGRTLHCLAWRDGYHQQEASAGTLCTAGSHTRRSTAPSAQLHSRVACSGVASERAVDLGHAVLGLLVERLQSRLMVGHGDGGVRRSSDGSLLQLPFLLLRAELVRDRRGQHAEPYSKVLEPCTLTCGEEKSFSDRAKAHVENLASSCLVMNQSRCSFQ